MQRVKILALRSKRRAKKDERGVALITTLLLLMLLTGLTLTMAWSARSDMLINGYYRNFRGAFYAADSGLNVVRQAAINQFAPGVGLPTTFAAGTPPIPVGTEATIATTINTNYASFTPLTGSGKGQAVNSWPGQFKLPSNTSFQLTQASCTVIGTPAPALGQPAWSCTNLPPNTTQFTYVYNYGITIQGQSRGGENATLFDRGQITLVANVVNASSKLASRHGVCSLIPITSVTVPRWSPAPSQDRYLPMDPGILAPANIRLLIKSAARGPRLDIKMEPACR